MRQLGTAALQPRDGQHTRIVDVVLGHAIGLDHTGQGTGGQGLTHVGTAVGGGPRPGHEGLVSAHAHAAAVHDQLGHTAFGQPGLHGGHVLKEGQLLGHQKLSTSAGTSRSEATMWGATAMSGSTCSRLSVCCTTWLNTGAATAPP